MNVKSMALQGMFEFDTHGLTAKYARTDIRKFSFVVRVVESWNKLADSVKQAAYREAFKRAMKNMNKQLPVTKSSDGQ
jgi:hypothetical protein